MQRPLSRKEQLEYCTICTHRKMDAFQGLVCDLTDEKARFAYSCPHFEADVAVEQQKKSARLLREKSKTKAYKTAAVLLGIMAIGWGITLAWSYYEESVQRENTEQLSFELGNEIERTINNGDKTYFDEHLYPTRMIQDMHFDFPLPPNFSYKMEGLFYSDQFPYGWYFQDRVQDGNLHYLGSRMEEDTAYLAFRLYSPYEAFEYFELQTFAEGDQSYIIGATFLNLDFNTRDIIHSLRPRTQNLPHYFTYFGSNIQLSYLLHNVQYTRRNLNRGNYAEAERYFNNIPHYHQNKYPIAKQLQYRLWQGNGPDDFARHLEYLRGSIQQNLVSRAINLMHHGVASGNLDEYQVAQEQLQQLLGSDPLQKLLEGRCLFNAGKFEEARMALDDFMTMHPHYEEPYFLQLKICLERGDFQEALVQQQYIHETFGYEDPRMWIDVLHGYPEYTESALFFGWLIDKGVFETDSASAY